MMNSPTPHHFDSAGHQVRNDERHAPPGSRARACNGPRMDSTRERRWVVLREDGRFITLGRASDPTDDELAEDATRAQGVAAWPMVMAGNPWTCTQSQLLEVRPLAGPTGSFGDATAAFLARCAPAGA